MRRKAAAVTLSAAKSLPRALRGDLSEVGQGILRFAQNDIGVWVFLVLALAACDRKDDGTMRLTDHVTAPPVSAAEEPPVAINPVSPVRYPPALLEQGIEGRVLLRLYADSTGSLVPDSTRLAESSGYPALDSAAMAGASELKFSPALLQGRPVAAPFLQPVQFRSTRSRSTTE